MRVRDEPEASNESQAVNLPFSNSSKVVLQLQHLAMPNANFATKP